MVEKIKGISINGRCFNEKTELDFFLKQSDRIAIIYGKNGSGKSTITEGIYNLSSDADESDVETNFLDYDGKTIDISDKIYVFNEKYIDKNVKIEADALGSIILLGGQVNIQSDIDKNKELIKQYKEEINKEQNENNKFKDIKNILCPQYHFEKIREILKQPNGWADNESKIKKLIRSASVTQDIVKEICEIHPTKSYDESIDEFNKIKELLKKVSEHNTTYDEEINYIKRLKQTESYICAILSRKIENPELTTRDKLIFKAIEEGRQDYVEKARKDFSNTKLKICPFCYQSLDDNYKRSLMRSFNKVLNKEVDLHKNELSKIEFPELIIDLNSFESLDSKIINDITKHVIICKEIIDTYNDKIKEKKENIYNPVKLKPLGLENEIEIINNKLNQLKDEQMEFNNSVLYINQLKEKAIKLNREIAHYQILSSLKDYQKQYKLMMISNDKLKAIEEKYNTTSLKLIKLEQKKANIGLARENINILLNYVFYTENRLSIILKNDKYYLRSNGADVKPSKVSVGERNIIALCYYFTQILENQDINDLYRSENLIVIDDPISSFDYDNKVGIISLLRLQFGNILNGNSNSKIIIFSHDLATIFDIQKATKEILKNNFSSLELKNRCLNKLKNLKNEYAELLERTYHYADTDKHDNNIDIGNEMRRVLEVFATFNYRKSIESVSYDEKILEALDKYSEYFKSRMYRLVLHGESHFEEQIYNLHDDAGFYQFISEEEKKQTAKDILCFMYILNPYHIQAYLKDEKGAVEKIKKWIVTIPKNKDFTIAI